MNNNNFTIKLKNGNEIHDCFFLERNYLYTTGEFLTFRAFNGCKFKQGSIYESQIANIDEIKQYIEGE